MHEEGNKCRTKLVQWKNHEEAYVCILDNDATDCPVLTTVNDREARDFVRRLLQKNTSKNATVDEA